jgi:hypothetical protein
MLRRGHQEGDRMFSKDKEVRRLKRQIRRVVRRGSGVLKWDDSGDELIRAVGQCVGRYGKIDRREAARGLGISYHQLDYVLSKYRKLPKLKPKRAATIAAGKKLKLAPVQIVDETPSEAPEQRRKGPVELVLENGMRVSVSSTDQVVDLLEQLQRRTRRLGAA